MPDFPAELVDSVIDLVDSCPSTLASCALVCRQWVPRSRYHHFASVQLVQARSGRDTVRPFLRLLASPLATFVSSVREVCIFHQLSYGSPVLSAGDIISLLRRHGVAPTFLHLSCRLDQLGRAGFFPSPTHLRLELGAEIGTSAFEVIMDFIHDFSGLASLALGADQVLFNTRMQFRALPPDLQEMEVTRPEILGNILLLDSPPILPRLTLMFIDQSGWDEVDRYLGDDRVRSQLRSLTLIDCSALPVLQSPAALRHLTIAKPFLLMPSHLYTALITLSGTSSARLLETITLRGTREHRGEYGYPASMNGVGCPDVDALLADADLWPRLRAVILRCDHENAEHEVALMRSSLPLADARGLVVVQYP